MNWKSLAIAALAFAVISFVIHMFGAIADMRYYTDPMNSRLWSSAMMPNGGAPGLNFMILSVIISIITGIILASAYGVLKENFKQKDPINRGLSFGIFLFILLGIPSFLSMALLFALPFGLQLSWLVQSMAVYLAGAVAFAKLL